MISRATQSPQLPLLPAEPGPQAESRPAPSSKLGGGRPDSLNAAPAAGRSGRAEPRERVERDDKEEGPFEEVLAAVLQPASPQSPPAKPVTAKEGEGAEEEGQEASQSTNPQAPVRFQLGCDGVLAESVAAAERYMATTVLPAQPTLAVESAALVSGEPVSTVPQGVVADRAGETAQVVTDSAHRAAAPQGPAGDGWKGVDAAEAAAKAPFQERPQVQAGNTAADLERLLGTPQSDLLRSEGASAPSAVALPQPEAGVGEDWLQGTEGGSRLPGGAFQVRDGMKAAGDRLEGVVVGKVEGDGPEGVVVGKVEGDRPEGRQAGIQALAPGAGRGMQKEFQEGAHGGRGTADGSFGGRRDGSDSSTPSGPSGAQRQAIWERALAEQVPVSSMSPAGALRVRQDLGAFLPDGQQLPVEPASSDEPDEAVVVDFTVGSAAHSEQASSLRPDGVSETPRTAPVRQVANAIQDGIANGRQTMEIELRPEGLGTLRLKLSGRVSGGVGNEDLRIDIKISTPEAHRLLSTHLDELKELLRTWDIRLGPPPAQRGTELAAGRAEQQQPQSDAQQGRRQPGEWQSRGQEQRAGKEEQGWFTERLDDALRQ